MAEIKNSTYVKRLRGLMNRREKLGTDFCNICPMFTSYLPYGRTIAWALPAADEGFSVKDAICRKCLDFINIPTRYSHDNGDKGCPCLNIGREQAIRRARSALKRWDKGVHKWQK